MSAGNSVVTSAHTQEAAGSGISADEVVARVQELTVQLDQLSDPNARKTAQEFMRAIMELYGLGLAKVVQVLTDSGERGAPIRQELIEDGVFASLLLIHDLYPVPLEDRIRDGLDTIRPYLASHGGSVEVLRIKEGVLYLRLEGSCKGCPASAATLELGIKKALNETAPDLVGIVVEGVVDHNAGKKTLLPMAGASAKPEPKQESAWFDVEGTARVPVGTMMPVDMSGLKLLVANVDGTMLAYQNACAGCGQTMEGGTLADGVLSCPSCERRYFLPRAGRSLDEERLHLVPIPLLYDEGIGVKVALAV